MTTTTQGVLYMLLASFFFALMSLCVKLLPGLPVPELIFFRAVISSVLCLFGMWRLRIAPLGNRRGLLLMRGIAGVVSLAQGYWLLQQIPLAAATTLTHLSPVFTTLIGIWFVKERITVLHVLFFGLSFLGVAVIEGFDYRISPLHMLVGITASFTMGIAYNCVRKLGRTEHPLVIILYFPLVCLPITGLWSALVWVPPSGMQWVWLLMLGLTTQAGQYCMTKSYQTSAISSVAIVNYTEVLFSIGLGLVLFDEHFNFMTYAGMALVISGVVMNVLIRQTPKQASS